MTRTAAIASRYRQLIHSRQLTAGMVLPTEYEMCGLFGVSRMTVRKAMDMLVEQGYVYRVSGEGTFVSPQALKRVYTVQGFSRYMARRGFTVESRVLEFACAAPAAAPAAALGLEDGAAAWQLVRSRSVDGKVLAIESVWLCAALFPGLDQYDFTRDSLYQVMKNDYGLEVVSQSQNIGTARVTGRNARLMFGEEAAVALRAVNLGYAAKGRCVEYEEALYNGFAFNLEVLIRKEWEG
jgi:GntR family transcriptional regulator